MEAQQEIFFESKFFLHRTEKTHEVHNKKILGRPFLWVKVELRVTLKVQKFEPKDKSDNSSQKFLNYVGTSQR